MVVRETKTLLWGLTLLYLFYFFLWLGQWPVNHEQLKKNLAVIWGVLMWTFSPICHCRPAVQFLLWELWCLRCILLYLKWLLHSTHASGIRLYSLPLLELSEQGLWPGNGSCMGTKLLLLSNNSHHGVAEKCSRCLWVGSVSLTDIPNLLYEALNYDNQLIRMSQWLSHLP